MWLVGATGFFERLVVIIPKSLCAAMLAGILLRFGINVFTATEQGLPGAAALVGVMFISYLVSKRYSARYAIVLTLFTGIALWLTLGWAPWQRPAARRQVQQGGVKGLDPAGLDDA